MATATNRLSRTTVGHAVRAVPDAAAIAGVSLLVGLGALIFALLARMPPIPSDQLNYFEFAGTFPQVPPTPWIDHQFQRVGLVLPLAAAIKMFGYSQAAYYVVPVVTTVALAIGVFALGTLLFARVVGVGAALLVLGNTAMFRDLAAPLPDLLAAALFCWALVLTIALRQKRPAVVATDRRRVATLLGIGVLLGWSYLAREFIVFVWPLVPILLFRHVGTRGLLWVALPMLAIGAAEVVLNAQLYGDPLARVQSVLGHGSGAMSTEAISSYRDQDRIWYVTRLTDGLKLLPEGPWLIGAMLATVAGGLVRRRSVGVLLLWVALLFVPLILLGGALSPATPMLRLTNDRYWYPIFPAFLLGGVAATWLLSRFLVERISGLRSRATLIAGMVVLLVAALPVVVAQQDRAGDGRYVAGGATQLEQLRSWLATDGAAVDQLWTDSRSVRAARLFAVGPIGGQVWRGRFDILPTDAAAAPQRGDHVLLYSVGRSVCSFCRAEGERLLGSPVVVPPSWVPVFSTTDGIVRVYQVS